MSELILPQNFELNEERARLAERHEALRWFDRQLKELDPQLELVKASERADVQDMIPGYWHIRRRNVIGLDTYIALTGPNDEFIEPHSGIIEELRKNDLQRAGAWEEFEKRLEEQETASRRRAEEQREQLREEFMERYKHHNGSTIQVKRK